MLYDICKEKTLQNLLSEDLHKRFCSRRTLGELAIVE